MDEDYGSCRNFHSCQGLVKLAVPDQKTPRPGALLSTATMLSQTCACPLSLLGDGAWLIEHRLRRLSHLRNVAHYRPHQDTRQMEANH